MIKDSERTEGMINASADYYQNSKIFRVIQNAQALEYDRIQANNEDLALQLSPVTATWGLDYWEEALQLPVRSGTDYEARRPAVLAKLQRDTNFSAEMVENLISAQGAQCTVSVDTVHFMIYVTFPNAMPTYMQTLIQAVDNIIHAHMIVTYQTEKEQFDSRIYYSSASPVITQHEKVQFATTDTQETTSGPLCFCGVMVYDEQTEYIALAKQNNDETVQSIQYNSAKVVFDTEYIPKSYIGG